MTHWLKAPAFQSAGKPTSQVPYHNVNRKAAFSAFKGHWLQILEVFELSRKRGQVQQDDVTIVTNHFAQTIDYLIVDLLHMSKTAAEARSSTSHVDILEKSQESSSITGSFPSDETENTPIFDHFMSEQILQTVLQWSLSTGEYVNQMKLEQLKAYEKLLAQSPPEMLVYKPILTPLLGLLNSCSGCNPVDVEKRLLVLLNQLCVSLMNNPKLVEYFFHTSEQQGPTKFLIFSLLLPFVHREGIIGQHARDVLLLCMALSASYPDIGVYIAQHSNFCPVLATGLSGLYSMLPRSLCIETEGWYRFSPDDVSQLPELKNFINSLEFCNAVIQVSHPMVRQQIVEFLYQGFLVPVLAPALFQSSQEDLVTALSYMELSLRTITEHELQRVFLALLLVVQEYRDLPLMTALITHLHSPNLTLRLVTLSLFATLLDLHSEDAMIILIFQYLCPCNFVMLSQRPKLSQPPYAAAETFLNLIPDSVKGVNQHTTLQPISSFVDYLLEARRKLSNSFHACDLWAWPYDGISPAPSQSITLIHTARIAPVTPYPKHHSEHCSLPCSTNVTSDRKRTLSLPDYEESLKEPRVSASLNGSSCRKKKPRDPERHDERHLDSLSSGYESFNLRNSRDSSPYHSARGPPEDAVSISSAELDEFFQSLEQVSLSDSLLETDDEDVFMLQASHVTQFTDDDIADMDSESSMPWLSGSSSSEYDDGPVDENSLKSPQPRPTIGPFLEALIQQVDQFLTNSIHTGLLAMTCLSTLSSYPTPLLTSLLLKPSVVLQPSVRSLYQVLSQLKKRIDETLVSEDATLLKQARELLISQFSSSSPANSSPMTSPQSLSRGEHKRKSISRKMGAFFKWATSSDTAKETPLQNLADGSGYRYINRPSPAQPSIYSTFYAASEEKRHVALSAVLLQEWLLQLAALSEEHTVWSIAYCFPPLKFPTANQ